MSDLWYSELKRRETNYSVIAEIDRVIASASPAARRELLLGWLERVERWAIAFPEYDQSELLQEINSRLHQQQLAA